MFETKQIPRLVIYYFFEIGPSLNVGQKAHFECPFSGPFQHETKLGKTASGYKFSPGSLIFCGSQSNM